MESTGMKAAGRSTLRTLGRSVLGVEDSHRRAVDLFLRLLAVVYFIAFLSLAVQVRGLIGETGILPAGSYLQRLSEMLGSRAFMNAPSLFWANHADFYLQAACWSGAAFSLLVVAGVGQGPLLLLNWVLYLSLVSVGQVFLHYQWDVLLLEAGFLAFWMAPWKRWISWSQAPEPPLLLVWLERWLIFRLMLSSGWVKVRNDEVWRNLSALDFHYWTQPLPTWTAWWLHHAPEITRQAGVAATLIVELIIPWLIFFGRPGRKVACISLSGFQILLMLSGNFGFFNLLTLALCIPLWSRPRRGSNVTADVSKRGERIEDTGPTGRAKPASLEARLRGYAAVPLALVVVLLSFAALARTEKRNLILPYPLDALERHLSPFFLANRYGLFADMTEERPELIVEVSPDGRTWQPLHFRWKPGPLDRRPQFTGFHMPRLDWQMWFEALNFSAQNGYYETRGVPPGKRTYYANLWFYQFARRVLDGPNAATGLLEMFPEEPQPGSIRAVAYRYRFSTPRERREDGDWWKRERISIYLPEMRLEHFGGGESGAGP